MSAAFDHGVHDIVTIPFSPEELLARVLRAGRVAWRCGQEGRRGTGTGGRHGVRPGRWCARPGAQGSPLRVGWRREGRRWVPRRAPSPGRPMAP